MTPLVEQTVHGKVFSEHVVQFFDMPETLGPAVAAFLRRGLDNGGNALVVARPRSVRAIMDALTAAGHDVGELSASGRLTILDAAETRRRFFVDGLPGPELFEEHVVPVVTQLADTASGHLHIYGEIVDLLAAEQNFAAVDALEELWTRLGARVPFAVLCGYSSNHFVMPRMTDRLLAVCLHHSRLQQGNSDVLANYLLESLPARASRPTDPN